MKVTAPVIRCPGCRVLVDENNAGGYRTYCMPCTDVMPEIPGLGAWQMTGRFPKFRWRCVTPRHVRMFAPRFAPLVEAGAKGTTIRPKSKRKIKVGDVLDLRAWLGKPYRSNQRRLREAYCTIVTPVSIRFSRGSFFVRVAKRLLAPAEVVTLAQRDGFKDGIELLLWFEKTHGLPFSGVLIEWKV